MKKQKKIGFRYFLNKRLKPVESPTGEKYSVYVQVTYNRQNTQFLLPLWPAFSLNGAITDNDFYKLFEQKSNSELNRLLAEFEQEISDCIRFEHSQLGDKFSMTGISDRREFYHRPFMDVFEKYAKENLKDFMANKVSEQELESLFNWSLFFVDSYYLSKQVIGEPIKEKLPADLVYLFTAYIQFVAFNSIRSFETDSFDTLKDWFTGRLNIDFKNFLFASLSENELFIYEAKSSPIWKLWREFPTVIQDVPKYLAAIDKMLLKGKG